MFIFIGPGTVIFSLWTKRRSFQILDLSQHSGIPHLNLEFNAKINELYNKL